MESLHVASICRTLLSSRPCSAPWNWFQRVVASAGDGVSDVLVGPFLPVDAACFTPFLPGGTHPSAIALARQKASTSARGTNRPRSSIGMPAEFRRSVRVRVVAECFAAFVCRRFSSPLVFSSLSRASAPSPPFCIDVSRVSTHSNARSVAPARSMADATASCESKRVATMR